MQLLRSLWFFVAYCDAELACFHITGQLIQLLTICHAMTCHAFFPCSPLPTILPPQLLQLVAVDSPDWTSTHFRKLFKAIITKV